MKPGSQRGTYSFAMKKSSWMFLLHLKNKKGKLYRERKKNYHLPENNIRVQFILKVHRFFFSKLEVFPVANFLIVLFYCHPPLAQSYLAESDKLDCLTCNILRWPIWAPALIIDNSQWFCILNFTMGHGPGGATKVCYIHVKWQNVTPNCTPNIW